MPATSKAQARFFGYLKGNPAAAKRRGISAKVVEEFVPRGKGSINKLPERARPKPRFGSLSGR
jgi:hypothetical protein